MRKSKTQLYLGIGLLVLTLVFILINANTLFISVNQGERSFLDIHIDDGIEQEEIITIIRNETGFTSDKVKFEENGNSIRVETGYINDSTMKTIEEVLNTKYQNKVYVSSSARTGKIEKLPALYVVYVVIVVCLVLSIYLIVKNKTEFSKKMN